MSTEASTQLAAKIGRLIEEQGWNQDEFARAAGLNRQTVRQLLLGDGSRRLHNATVGACARVLGLSVSELRHLPLERLLPRLRIRRPTPDSDAALRRLYEEITQPHLLAWIEQHPERAKRLSPDEIDELLSLQGVGGPLTPRGIEEHVERIERRRTLVDKVRIIASTEYLELLEQLVGLMYEKIQPYTERE